MKRDNTKKVFYLRKQHNVEFTNINVIEAKLSEERSRWKLEIILFSVDWAEVTIACNSNGILRSNVCLKSSHEPTSWKAFLQTYHLQGSKGIISQVASKANNCLLTAPIFGKFLILYIYHRQCCNWKKQRWHIFEWLQKWHSSAHRGMEKLEFLITDA